MAHVLSGGSPPPHSSAAPVTSRDSVNRILGPLSLQGRARVARNTLASRGAVAECPLSVHLRVARAPEHAGGAPWRPASGLTVLALWKSKKPGRRRSATVELSEFSSDGSSTDAVVLTAKTKELAVPRSPSASGKETAPSDGPLQTVQHLVASVGSVAAPVSLSPGTSFYAHSLRMKCSCLSCALVATREKWEAPDCEC